MNKDIEITDFKNFSQFLAYNRQHAAEMNSWSAEQLKEYCEKVMSLRESNPKFREEYDKWTKLLEAKQNCHITIGGTPEETASARAWLMLKKRQEKRKEKENEKSLKADNTKSQPDIVILNRQKKTFTI